MTDREAFEAWFAEKADTGYVQRVKSIALWTWQAAIASERAKGEVVVTKNDIGQIVAVTRQDDDHRILSVIAESAPIPSNPGELNDASPLVNIRPAPHAAAAHVPSAIYTIMFPNAAPINHYCRPGDGYAEGENPPNKVLYINMAPFGLNFLHGKDMENLLDYGRAIWKAAIQSTQDRGSYGKGASIDPEHRFDRCEKAQKCMCFNKVGVQITGCYEKHVDRAIKAMQLAEEMRKAKLRVRLGPGVCLECEGEGELGGQFTGGTWPCDSCGGTGKETP